MASVTSLAAWIWWKSIRSLRVIGSVENFARISIGSGLNYLTGMPEDAHQSRRCSLFGMSIFGRVEHLGAISRCVSVTVSALSPLGAIRLTRDRRGRTAQSSYAA